ncbi:integral membrane protein [Renibacterium salmoninarum ATCC 33209]|uniref:Integral membrane protein n=1 Tax=Renibacterium salmoninarum (strain ATCC 33209 / DSM 20767 / JCM 11484 / NBRC 15589 / NCIMB 2235) TaxID=288705 RepID=A9WUP0_RENSM|nr:alpha/beta hydrolase-fold protein [Renibacterium salmoninarum]ABY24911.1 integral membrane protein [Renibacterium salmoninarum ATCC 33209]
MAGIGLTTGFLTILLPVLGVIGLAWLLIGPVKHLRLAVPSALVIGAVVGFGAKFLIDDLINPWGAPLDWRIYLFVGIGVAALALLVPRMFGSKRWFIKIIAPIALILVVVAVAGQINQVFGGYPTLGSIWGDNGVKIEVQSTPPPDQSLVLTAQTPTVKLADWVPPADMPAKGKVVRVAIPGTVSGVISGDNYIYIPPAYQVENPANVPVLVLIHGNPGGSIDWLQSGQLAQEMDAYAAANKGIAPLVVMPDVSANYSSPNWPLCMDSNLSKGGTFLAVDVPNYVRSTYRLGLGSSQQFAIGGFSFGGTCALQMGTVFPAHYHTFIDISGERAPFMTGGDAAIVKTYFGGDAAAFAKVNPLDVLKSSKLSNSKALVIVGGNDGTYRPQNEEVFRALKTAGVQASFQLLPGGHSWSVWKPGLMNNIDWLMQQYGVR